MKRVPLFLLCYSLLLLASCSKSTPTICGRYTEATLNRIQENGKPLWIESPGDNCAVGYADWGNSNKKKARFAAYNLAKENLVRTIAPETVKVESELNIRKTKTNNKVTITAQGTSHLKSKGEEVQIKTKERAVWFQGFNVWILVERIP